MYIHFLSVDKNLWCDVTEGPYISKDDNDVVKHPKDWTDDETKNASYNLKVRNIIISTLNVNVFYSISIIRVLKVCVIFFKLSVKERRTSRSSKN